jgi:hypothetical protein
MNRKETQYFSVHSLNSIYKKNGFSIVWGNVQNTDYKYKKALEWYPTENFYIEFHEEKKSLTPLIYR